MTYVNETFVRMFGYSKEELIGKEIAFIYSKDQIPKLEEALKATMEGGWTGELVAKRKNGELFPMAISSTVVMDEEGGVIAHMASHKDITERKRAEEKRKQLLKELEAKNTEMERFTYTVSHDLRSPLVTVQGFVKMLREDLVRNEKEKVESDLKYIENGTAKMDRLLNDTLRLSRIGRMVNPPEDVSFGEIVQEALEQTAQQIKSSGVEISVVEDFPTVHMDRMRIVEVLVNLVTNSINYMGEQPHPKIGIGYRVDNEETVFFVRDNGVGIDKSQHEKVFELFYTVDTSGKGTGAGLAIVKRIIEVHNGKVWIESEKGKGCTVCFTLPVA
ncbi:MAG: PAS domain-containing sensor histidine kinase [Halobacteriota archaeon]